MPYDNVSDVLGLNTRMRWIIEPGNDLFLVFNQRWIDTEDGGFRSIAHEGQFKVQYTYRFWRSVKCSQATNPAYHKNNQFTLH